MNVTDKTLKALQIAAKYREMRQEIISSNVANAETPGYKAKRLEFEEALSRALDTDGALSMKKGTDEHYDVGSGGFNNLKPDVIEDPNGVVSQSGNTVDVEREMSLMAQNKVMHEAIVQLINKKLALMKYTIASEK
ncbi:flagellar basal body rod protein FlgB [Bacteriovoracaceae bacterium]|nr:flagellar basal body rod protein FlgB [Bacteriovoracaceae bacterium]